MGNELCLAIIWTIALITDIVSCVMGYEPSWILVFCPLVCLTLNYWIDSYFENKGGK